MKPFRDPGYWAIVSGLFGLALLAAGARDHAKLVVFGLGLCIIGVMLGYIWHCDRVEHARKVAHGLADSHLRLLAEQSAKMTEALLNTYKPDIPVLVNGWGQNYDNTFSGWAVDVFDRPGAKEPLWSIHFDATGGNSAKVWIAKGAQGHCTSRISSWRATLMQLARKQ